MEAGEIELAPTLFELGRGEGDECVLRPKCHISKRLMVHFLVQWFSSVSSVLASKQAPHVCIIRIEKCFRWECGSLVLCFPVR